MTPLWRRSARWTLPVLAGLAVVAEGLHQAPATGESPDRADVGGMRDPAWSPDGTRVAVSFLDQIWLLTAEGEASSALVTWPDDQPRIERDPAWSADGRRVAFAADRGLGFDLFIVDATGGTPERVTFLAGDERWPSWTPDGRVVFAHRASEQWDLSVIDAASAAPGAPPRPEALAHTSDDEMHPRVSPDGAHLAFVSTRETSPPDLDLWVMPLPARGAHPRGDTPALLHGARRVLRADGADRYPSWSPDGDRLAFSATRQGVGSVWVASVDRPTATQPDEGTVSHQRPSAPPVLLSRHGGQPSWSPEGETIVVAGLPEDSPGYNGDPRRLRDAPPPLFAGDQAFRLRALPAPRLPDEDAAAIVTTAQPDRERWLVAFDRVWETLRSLYYTNEPAATTWRTLGATYRARAARAQSADELEAIVDALIAEQPLVNPEVTSRGALVVAAHPLAAAAGVQALADGGNVVDAAIAVSFALGVVEPDASGIGGDGMALLSLREMEQPTLIDFKDQSPSRATLDNPAILHEGRLVTDGPAAMNVPGVVAGMEYLFQHYGSGQVTWDRLLAPAIRHAEQGFVLDRSLPTTLAAARALIEKYPETARIFLPDGRLPRAGERFRNPEYGATLRTIATEGAQAFYEGRIADRIVEDLTQHGGILGAEDLAQYRAIERAPLEGRYRGHALWSSAPPSSSGAALIETLQILGHYTPKPGTTFRTDADYWHYAIEAWKARDPMRQVADPARWTVEVDEHLTPAHAESLFRVIRPDRASEFRDPGIRPEPGEDTDTDPARETDTGLGRGTSAFVVADTLGNVIVVTQTLSTWGGSFYVSKDLGFLYNNHLKAYRTTRGAYGQLLPLTRSSTTNAVSLVLERGETRRPLLALGAAGNQWIIPSVLQTIAGVIDGGLSAQEAVEAPRFLVERDPSDAGGRTARVAIEDRFPGDLLEDLAARGHRLRKIGRKGEARYGYASAVLIDWDRGVVMGGADPRRSHAAAAWEP